MRIAAIVIFGFVIVLMLTVWNALVLAGRWDDACEADSEADDIEATDLVRETIAGFGLFVVLVIGCMV